MASGQAKQKTGVLGILGKMPGGLNSSFRSSYLGFFLRRIRRKVSAKAAYMGVITKNFTSIFIEHGKSDRHAARIARDALSYLERAC
jgi:hypothetical protein